MVSSTEGNLVQNKKLGVWLATIYFEVSILAYLLYDDITESQNIRVWKGPLWVI